MCLYQIKSEGGVREEMVFLWVKEFPFHLNRLINFI